MAADGRPFRKVSTRAAPVVACLTSPRRERGVLEAELANYRHLGTALAIGLLVGVERYKARQEQQRESAGVRTFAVIALMGAAGSLVGEISVTLTCFTALAVLLGIGYVRSTDASLGLTTELSALLVFWLGYLTREHAALALSTAVVLVILLASKRTLHRFVRAQVSDLEFYDTLKFLAVVFVVMPMLPSRAMGPYDFFNPSKAWMLVIVVSSISYFGYVLTRVLGGERGLLTSAVVGGIVSTTAVTMSLASQARQNPAGSRAFGVAGVAANAVQLPRLLLLVAVVDAALARALAPALMAMFAAGVAGAWLVARVGRRGVEAPAIEVAHANPYSFLPALKFAALFVVVLLVSRVASEQFGAEGVYLAAACAGLVDVSAIALSLGGQVAAGALAPEVAARGVLVAVAANAVVKLALATQGRARFALVLTGGFVTMLSVGAVVTFL